MAKKTTKKSATKKKSTPKKEPKNVKQEKAAAPTKSKTPKKSAAGPKTKKGKAAPAKKPAKAAASAEKLILKKFDVTPPENLYVPPRDEAAESRYSAPPFASDAKKAKQISGLLFKQFDLSAAPDKAPKAKAKKAAAPKKPAKKKLSPKELIFQKFDVKPPESLYVPPAGKGDAGYTAPPFTTDKAEAERFSELLYRKYALKDFPSVEPKPKAAPKKEEKPKAVKKPEPPKKPVSVKELIHKKFDVKAPEKVYAPPAGKGAADYAAPPFTTDKAEAERFAELIARKYVLKDFPSVAPKPKPAPKAGKKPAPPKKPASVKELIHKKFDVKPPEKVYAAPAGKGDADYAAPPFTTDKAEAQRFAELISRKYVLKDFPSVAPKPKPAPGKAAPVKPPEPVKPAEPVKKPAAPVAPATKKEPEPKVTVTYDEPPTPKKGSDPMDKTMKYVIAGLVLLLAAMIAVSASNSKKYFIEPTEDGVAVYQGRFAPTGKKLLMELEGAQMPAAVKDVYTKSDVDALAFNYYVAKSDSVIETPGIPDFQAIIGFLDEAKPYANTTEARKLIDARLNSIDLAVLMFKADISASKGTLAGYDAALAYMNEAARLRLSENQTNLVNQKIAMFQSARDAIAPAEEAVEEAEAPAEEAHAAEAEEAPAEEVHAEKSHAEAPAEAAHGEEAAAGHEEAVEAGAAEEGEAEPAAGDDDFMTIEEQIKAVMAE